MDDLHPVPAFFNKPAQGIGNEHTPVPAAGAAHADHQLAFPFLDILGQQELDQAEQLLLEFTCHRLLLDVLHHRLVVAAQLFQFSDV